MIFVYEPEVDINGFKDPAHRLTQVTFTDVKDSNGSKPEYEVKESEGVVY